MPAYMMQFSYTNQAAASLVKNPEDRGAAFREQVEKVSGEMLAFYHCIGEYDVRSFSGEWSRDRNGACLA